MALLVVVGLLFGYFRYIKKENDDIGAGVRVQSTQLKDGLKASRDKHATKLPYPTSLVRSIVSYRIGPSGPLPAPMTVRLPVDAAKAAPAADEQLMVFTSESRTGPWESIPAQLDGVNVVVTVRHLSVLDVAKVKVGDAAKRGANKVRSVIGSIRESFSGISDDLLANAKAPTCDRKSDALKDGYDVRPDKASAKKNTILWCVGMVKNKAGKLVRGIKMVNNRKYPVTVTHTGMGVVDAGSIRGELSELSRALSGKNSVILPSETVVFGPLEFPSSGGVVRFHVEMDGLAQSLYALETGLRTAATILTRFGAGSSSTTSQIIRDPLKRLDAIDKLMKVPDCANAIRQGDANIGSILRGCLSAKEMGDIFGKSAIFLAPIMVLAPVLKFFQSEFNALGDQFNGRDRYDLIAGRLNMDELCPEGPDACYGTRQGDVDGNGSLDSIAIYFDKEEDNYFARVIYDNGDTATESFGFPSPEDDEQNPIPHDPSKEHFSYFGLSDINGDGSVEVFTKALIKGQWYISALGDAWDDDGANREKEGTLFGQQFDGLITEFPMSTSEPFGLQAFWRFDKITESGGFTCQKSANGHPLLMVWWVYADDDGAHIEKVWFGLEDTEVGIWSSISPGYGVKLPETVDEPLHGSAAATIEKLRAQTCPGLPKMPLTGGTSTDAKQSVLQGAGVS